MNRMRAGGLAAALSIVGGLAVAVAAEKPVADFYPPQPKPAAALAAFKDISGSWACQGTMPAGATMPGSPAASYRSRVTVAPVYGGFAYTIAYEQTFADKKAMVFAGTWYVGFDDVKKTLVYFWLDNMGTVGQGTSTGWAGGKLVLTGVGTIPVPSGDGTAQSRPTLLRDSFTKASDKTLHWTGEMKPEGAPDWKIIGQDDCSRT